MTTPVLIPLRHYNLGNALSVLAGATILADRIGGSCWFRQFEPYDELFEGQPSRHGEMTAEEMRFAGGRVSELQMFGREYRERFPELRAIHRDEWYEYVEVADETLVVRRRRKYFAPLEAVDEDLLRGYRMVGLYTPYQLSYQVAFDVGFLRDRFRFNAEHVVWADAMNDHVRGDRETLVGVHVRLGDYRTWRGGRFVFPLGDVVRVLSALNARAPGRYAFRLFSNELDEREVAAALADHPSLHCAYAPGDALSDFCGLARCDVVFGPPSSFGHWAAFLGSVPRVVFNNIEVQRRIVTPGYLAALRPVAWPFSIGLANDFWVV